LLIHGQSWILNVQLLNLKICILNVYNNMIGHLSPPALTLYKQTLI